MALNNKISEIIKDQLKNKGYDLVKVDVSFGSKASVNIDIDRFDGKPVSIDDCVTANQLISAILDVENLIHEKYNLNVSSPGEFRPLNNEDDFQRFCGHDVVIELNQPIKENGQRKLRGVLLKIDNSVVYLNEKNESSETKIDFSNIKKASVHRVFKI
ncbi:MAG: ribosome maturation factor RimP [Alphaproteobacteria bacterium]|nr:ribosome maturation factor RimP [Alphaproteobacteria bacterium]